MSFHGKKYVCTPKNNDPKGLHEKKKQKREIWSTP